MERKKELRKYIALLKGQQENVALRQLRSANILNLLEEHPAFKKANTVLLYYSLEDEVATHDFIQKWSKMKQMLLPVVIGDDLELRLYSDTQEMEISSYGIKEPIGAPFTDFLSIDCIVVPGLAFDNKGHRLGRGKGYYDRLLPQLTHAFKVGICFPFQLVDEVPTESFDICMDEVITCHE